MSEITEKGRSADSWRWIRGVVYIILVALIWIAASFVVQSVVDSGVSPFLITYICNSLFVVYIPIVEGSNWIKSLFERKGWGKTLDSKARDLSEKGAERMQQVISSSERQGLLENRGGGEAAGAAAGGRSEVETDSARKEEEEELQQGEVLEQEGENLLISGKNSGGMFNEEEGKKMDDVEDKQPWSRKRTALAGLSISPFWFLAQLTYNFSLKFTTVTSNTILSTTSSLFTLLVSVQFLGERFTWGKLVSVLLCMLGSVLVALGDSWKEETEIASRPFLGDVLTLVSAMFYATYTAQIRVQVPDEADGKGKCSTALVLGYIGLFNALIFGPFALTLHFTGIEPFHRLTLLQLGLIVGKGLFDNVFSDYLWARAVLLTSPTVATAGLTIQVPIAAVIDSLRGIVPSFVNIVGAISVLIGFFGINRAPIEKESEIEDTPHSNSTTVISGV